MVLLIDSLIPDFTNQCKATASSRRSIKILMYYTSPFTSMKMGTFTHLVTMVITCIVAVELD